MIFIKRPNPIMPMIHSQKNLFFFSFAKSAHNSLLISIPSSDQIYIKALKALLALGQRDDIAFLFGKGKRKL